VRRLNEHALTRALAAAGLSAPVRWDDVTASTNETARAMAIAGAPAWTLVAAGHQTAGRGRAGRTWVDRPGGAVMFSVVLRPSLAPERLGVVALAAGAAVAGSAAERTGAAVRCKWPNDLIVDGAKVGGILAESEVDGDTVRYVVVGVGVNLEAPEGVEGAGALGPTDPEALIAGSLRRLEAMLRDDPARILEAWRAVSDTLGRRVEARSGAGEAVRGLAADVDDTGALVLETPHGRRRVAAGDVVHLRAAGDGA
jgi:BirA family biotin operon repressor/biotin-[acetyl-CoA-carboxylase] ligase